MTRTKFNDFQMNPNKETNKTQEHKNLSWFDSQCENLHPAAGATLINPL